MKLIMRSLFILICMVVLVPRAYAQSENTQDRQLRIFEPADDIQPLDPAFELIMEKIDDDLQHILSSPTRLTPRGTAITGLTLLGTLYLFNEDEEILADIVDARDEDSDDVFERLRVLGRNVPSTIAGLYLLGYFLDSKNLKSSSLESFEAIAITALITAGTSFVIGHKGPDDSSTSDEFKPFNKYRSMPDMDSSLIFSVASVYAYEKSTLEALLYYSIAAGTAYSRLHFEDAWPSDVFLGSILGTAIGRTVASRARDGGDSKFTLLPVLEHNERPAIGLKVEFKL